MVEGHQRYRGYACGDGETAKRGDDGPGPRLAIHAIVPRCLL
jgi:hypothetical protein